MKIATVTKKETLKHCNRYVLNVFSKCLAAKHQSKNDTFCTTTVAIV